MKKIHLVVDARMVNSSGIGTYLKNILPGLTDKFDVTLLGKKQELESFLWSQKCSIISFTSKIYSFNEQLKYPFKVPSCDLFWSPHFNHPILPVRAKKRITTIHDVNHLACKKNYSYFISKYADFLYRNAIKKSNKVITVSEFSRSQIANFFKVNHSDIVVIHNGVSDIFSVVERKFNIVLPEDFILYVGNIKPHKNVSIVLEAYNKLSDKFKSKYKLVILGKKEGFRTKDYSVLEFIENNNFSTEVFFAENVTDNDLPMVYKKAKIFIFPSLYEGFGLPVLEAMASGTPVICSNIPALTEVGGDSVSYFHPRNSDELKLVIEKLIADDGKLAKEYCIKGLERVKSFSWQKSIDKHIKIFIEVANPNLD